MKFFVFILLIFRVKLQACTGSLIVEEHKTVKIGDKEYE